MKKLIASELIEKMKEMGYSVPDLGYGYEIDQKILGKMTEVDRHGGEGEGENWWRTYHFEDHNVYLKVSGWYTSYRGTDFQGWDEAVKEVKPKEKLITVYE